MPNVAASGDAGSSKLDPLSMIIAQAALSRPYQLLSEYPSKYNFRWMTLLWLFDTLIWTLKNNRVTLDNMSIRC